MRNSLVSISTFLFLLGTAVSAGDWTHWRGPDQNGVSTEKNLPSSWSQDGENLLWHVPHGSRATPLVMGDRVYLINRAGMGESLQERVMCLDLVSGKTIWEDKFNVFLTDVVEHRLGWANLAADAETGYVYAHGVQGLFTCYNGADGKIIWQHSLTESFGRISGYGGRTHSPIVEGDLVILGSSYSSWGNFGKALHRVSAFDKRTGEIQWWYSSPGEMLDTTYSTAIVVTQDGMRLYIAGYADGTIQALKANTGEMVWTFNLSKRGINTSVVYQDGRVYASHSEENLDNNVMGTVICIDATQTGDITDTGTIWRKDGMGVGYASPALDGELLYMASNKANLHCLDAKTGEQYWEYNFGVAAKGSPTIADGKAYIGEEGGTYHILKVDKKGCEELNKISFHKENGAPIEIYSSPSIADGRVLLATKDDTWCIGTKPVTPTPAKVIKPEPVTPGEVAYLMVTPAEIMIPQGGSQKFLARTYDNKGNYIGEVEAEWSAAGLKGSFNGNNFQAAPSGATQGGMVTAKSGERTATARVRIIPSLPYSETFDDVPDNKSPAGWQTSPLKSKVVNKDGDKVLMKTADRMAPPFARMRNYIMPPLDAGYTIQADLFGESKKKRFWPDMGLINSRYMLRFMGTTTKPLLRLVTWDPLPRMQVDLPYEWKPDQWYTAKLSFDIKDGKGLVRAKVWLRGEPEPAEWTTEMIDSTPNTGGSPGLYGYSVAITETAPGTPVYFDNIKITRN